MQAIRNIQAVLATFFLFLLSGYSFATEDLCDRYAANPNDRNKTGPGVVWDNIDIALAEKHCAIALEDSPNNPRYQYQYARALTKAKKWDQALLFYQKSVKQNYALAQFGLAIMYEEGTGIKKNVKMAIKWYRKAAENGYVNAQSVLADMYYNGKEKYLEKDYAQALKWYRKAAEQGNSYSQDMLGDMYYYGKGIEKDYEQSAYWYRKAAEQGYEYAQYSLGYLYEKGEGIEKDYEQSVLLYRKAAEQGNERAQYQLGNMYYFGKGVEQDFSVAARWYREAAEKGNRSSQNDLGVMYHNGMGVNQDIAEAIKWYRKAAEQDEPHAQYNLGKMYEKGQGVIKDNAQALTWYRKAANQGHRQAKTALEKLNNKMLSRSEKFVRKYVRIAKERIPRSQKKGKPGWCDDFFTHECTTLVKHVSDLESQKHILSVYVTAKNSPQQTRQYYLNHIEDKWKHLKVVHEYEKSAKKGIQYEVSGRACDSSLGEEILQDGEHEVIIYIKNYGAVRVNKDYCNSIAASYKEFRAYTFSEGMRGLKMINERLKKTDEKYLNNL